MNPSSAEAAKPPPPFWCDVCQLDLQSEQSLEVHEGGHKHTKRKHVQSHKLSNSNKRQLRSEILPPIDEEELFADLAAGKYQNIVVLTGAGVSTAAGVKDFRSPGGLFEQLQDKFASRFPKVDELPEMLLSRDFRNSHDDVWQKEILPMLTYYDIAEQNQYKPTLTHQFCAWLHQQGFLRRVYTQNVDGLHTHKSLNLPSSLVVECHGSFAAQNLVLYQDPLPQHFYDTCKKDFSEETNKESSKVDLVLVFGTSLQVAPFCAIPNLAARGCVRVLVNRCLNDCYRNSFNQEDSSSFSLYGGSRTFMTTSLGGHKNVSLKSLWLDRKGNKRWRQLMVESDCDDFVRAFFASPACVQRGFRLDDDDDSAHGV